MWGDVGRCGEMWGDVGSRYSPPLAHLARARARVRVGARVRARAKVMVSVRDRDRAPVHGEQLGGQQPRYRAQPYAEGHHVKHDRHHRHLGVGG